jgi:hypothetical protein
VKEESPENRFAKTAVFLRKTAKNWSKNGDFELFLTAFLTLFRDLGEFKGTNILRKIAGYGGALRD